MADGKHLDGKIYVTNEYMNIIGEFDVVNGETDVEFAIPNLDEGEHILVME